MPRYRNKNIKFNMDDEKDAALWENLQSLPHGDFSNKTKAMWEERILIQRIERTEQNPESAKPWESVRRDNEQ